MKNRKSLLLILCLVLLTTSCGNQGDSSEAKAEMTEEAVETTVMSEDMEGCAIIHGDEFSCLE